MKKALFMAVAFALFLSVKAQVTVDPDTKLIIYQGVVDQEGIKDTLYNRAIHWINSHYENPQSVMKVNDVDAGKIIGRHRIRMVDTDEEGNVLNSNTIVNYKFTIECKENRYRYTFDDFTMQAVSKFPLERWLDKEDPMYTPKWEEYLAQVHRNVNDIIADLKKGMKPIVKKNDDW